MTSLEVPQRCPAYCIKISENGDHKKGFLEQVDKNKDRWFCTTPGCKFAFRDEHKIDHWMGGTIPNDLRTEEHEEFVVPNYVISKGLAVSTFEKKKDQVSI
jgi:hypothetical protein